MFKALCVTLALEAELRQLSPNLLLYNPGRELRSQTSQTLGSEDGEDFSKLLSTWASASAISGSTPCPHVTVGPLQRTLWPKCFGNKRNLGNTAPEIRSHIL